MLYMLTAGKKALEDGGVTEEVMNQFEKTRCGVLIGSAIGGMKVCVSSAYSNREALTLALEPSCLHLRIHLTFSMTSRITKVGLCICIMLFCEFYVYDSTSSGRSSMMPLKL